MKTGHHQADFSVADPISISMVLLLTAALIPKHLQAPLLSQAQNLQVKVRANLAKNIVVPTLVPKQVQQVLEQPAAQLVLTKELNIVKHKKDWILEIQSFLCLNKSIAFCNCSSYQIISPLARAPIGSHGARTIGSAL